jgi:hypothetical protein
MAADFYARVFSGAKSKGAKTVIDSHCAWL